MLFHSLRGVCPLMPRAEHCLCLPCSSFQLSWDMSVTTAWEIGKVGNRKGNEAHLQHGRALSCIGSASLSGMGERIKTMGEEIN